MAVMEKNGADGEGRMNEKEGVMEKKGQWRGKEW